jgi:hypothetical protein
MPVAPFEAERPAILAANRSEAGPFSGGLVLNASHDSARFGKDFNLFQKTDRKRPQGRLPSTIS